MKDRISQEIEDTARQYEVKATLKSENMRQASQWYLMWRRFRRHKLAVISMVVLGLFYGVAVVAEFIAPYDPEDVKSEYRYLPPQLIHFVDKGKLQLRPFVYGYEMQGRDPVTLERKITIDKEKKYPMCIFCKGSEYKLWGLIRSDIHLFGTDEGIFPLLGTDDFGRDLFSRIVYGSRISLSIGLIGVFASLIIGITLGGLSGFFGGVVDNIIQRIIEFLQSIPTLPLWMGLSAALPKEWSIIKVYFAITLILSIVGWTGLARVVRGKFLSLRNEEFVFASRNAGAGGWWIISRHLVPSFLGYIIVSLTLAIPGMILGETALSFLGLGLQAPAISWGVLLRAAQNMTTLVLHPWLLFIAPFIIVTVLAFNFLGDALRDAADPYESRRI